MNTINNAAELQLAIREKQFELEIHSQMLKEGFYIAYESLKPSNLIKSTLSEITSSPYLIDNMLGSIMGLVSGFITKKIAVGKSHNMFRQIIGTVLQFGVTNLVAQHPDALKTFGEYIIEKLFHNNHINTQKT